MEPDLIPIEVLHCGIGNFALFCLHDLDLDPMTYTNLIVSPEPLKMYAQIKNELSTYVNAFESYCVTDIQTYRQTDTDRQTYRQPNAAKRHRHATSRVLLIHKTVYTFELNVAF